MRNKELKRGSSLTQNLLQKLNIALTPQRVCESSLRIVDQSVLVSSPF
jgi:hypothetical protein